MLLSGFGDFRPGSCLPSGETESLELRRSSTNDNWEQMLDTSF
jgi:hypothetical protein